jgi:RsmE family RNA methyltransferase
MNLLLFRDGEWADPLPSGDKRVIHIKKILRASRGDRLDAGVVGGSLGTAVIEKIGEDGSMKFSFRAESDPTPLYPITLLVGTPRPPTARRLLKDLSTAGIKRIIFCGTDLGEKSYLTSSLWVKEEYKQAVLEGISQGKTTLAPEVLKFYSLFKAIETMKTLEDKWDKLALDNVSPDLPLKEYTPSAGASCLAIGPERGWSDREREMLREKGFSVCSMGSRVLRTETACHMGLALIEGASGII